MKRRPLTTPDIAGFTLLRVEEFSCSNDLDGDRRFSVAVYRHEAFASAVRAASGAAAGPTSDSAAASTASDTAIDTEFVLLPPATHPGRFFMGSRRTEAGRGDDEFRHPVRIRQPFLIARTCVSQRVYSALRGAHDPWATLGPLQPATHLSWFQATEFCGRAGLRLPSEAEWEFACRAGSDTAFCFGTNLDPRVANFDPNVERDLPVSIHFRGHTVDVGQLPCNAFGLHEVHGNVVEWCEDRYHADYRAVPSDGTAWTSGTSNRVYRGGGWDKRAEYCRSACRLAAAPSSSFPDVGVRPACSVPQWPS